MSGVHVEQVVPGLTASLRQRVLRPHQTVAELVAAPPSPGTVAFAGFVSGAVVGSALVMPDPFPDRPAVPGAWRVRGMATDAGHRGEGVGSAVLQTAIDYARTAGGELVWCNARVAARGFYQRAGFAATGPEFDEPNIGRHIRMWRPLP